MKFTVALATAGLMAAAIANAATVPVEVKTLESSKVTLYVQPFLKPNDLTTLRLVATNKQALNAFVNPNMHPFSAVAVAPNEGFLQSGGGLAPSAIVGSADVMATATKQALDSCNGKRHGGPACVIVLTVEPAH